MTAPLRAVLFDLDGTLLDSIELILGGFREMMRVHHGHVPSDEVWLAGIGTPLADQIAHLAADAAQAEAIRETYAAYNVRHHEELAAPYPGVVPVVEQLRAAGTPLALITSKRRRGALRGLDRMGLSGAFDLVLGADDVLRAKPDPWPVTHALERLGVAPRDAVFVGDSSHDMAAGRAAGVRTAASLWGPFSRASLEAHAPTWWLDHPQELLAIVASPDDLGRRRG